MNKSELNQNIALAIEQERTILNYSQAEMAKALDVSLSTYKRIVSGQTDKVDAYLIYRFYKLTGKFFFEMAQFDSPMFRIVSKLKGISERQQGFIDAILDFELLFQETGRKHELSVLVPTGDMEDGMIWDSAYIEKISVPVRENVHLGIKITSSHLNPVYVKGDIILISKRPIRDGDIGIFINKETRRAYIRKLVHENPCHLVPINEYGETFDVDIYDKDSISKWIKFGVVVSKVR